jgi:hypothetical protein
MKKKTAKKLKLNRETLANLDLQQVTGGATVGQGGCATGTTCENSNGAHTCVTCGQTCTSNLC